MLVTEEQLVIERKGIDAEPQPNFVHLIMASNERWVVPAGAWDRRFFVLDVSKEHMRDTAYFQRIQSQMDNGGREALLHMLMNLDLSDFEVRAVPKTRALIEQQHLSLRVEEEWWLHKLMTGSLDPTEGTWKEEVMSVTLQRDFTTYLSRFHGRQRSGATRLISELQAVLPEGYPKVLRSHDVVMARGVDGVEEAYARPLYYGFPSLEECRKFWCSSRNEEVVWQDPEDRETIDGDSPLS
jgi:hypothetical protein